MPAAALAAGPTTPGYGVTALATVHNCSSGPQGGPGECIALNSALQIDQHGGPGSSSASASIIANPSGPQAGSSAAASGSLTGLLGLPTLHAIALSAGADSRMDALVQAFQTYTNNGASTPFSLAGTVQFNNSSPSPSDPFLAGGGGYDIYLSIWDAAQFPAHPTLANDCSTPGVLGFGLTFGILQGGAFQDSVATTACNSASLILAPGQQVVIDAQFNIIDNRGGFGDASHTFTTFLDPRLGANVIADLQSSLSPAFVPEPAGWALMLAGFGLAGFGLRTARRRIAA
jgi:hypothetical protein